MLRQTNLTRSQIQDKNSTFKLEKVNQNQIKELSDHLNKINLCVLWFVWKRFVCLSRFLQF